MIVRTTFKTHAEIDFDAAVRLFADREANEELSGELITSVFDLYSVETLRDRYGLRIGESFPTDIFVFGKGEPENPSCTKIGGRPFWPADQEWPTLPDGSPQHFLAQFNFSDSADLVGESVAGHVLLLLTDATGEWLWGNNGFSFHWIPTDIEPAKNLIVPSTIGCAGPFYGVIHRSADYPDSADAAFKTNLDQSYNLPILNGTKIGGLAHFIQSGAGTDKSFLCQLGSIQAAPRVRFPWVNHREPLNLEFNNSGIYGKDNCAVFGDMGSIYLFVDEEGKVSRNFECY